MYDRLKLLDDFCCIYCTLYYATARAQRYYASRHSPTVPRSTTSPSEVSPLARWAPKQSNRTRYGNSISVVIVSGPRGARRPRLPPHQPQGRLCVRRQRFHKEDFTHCGEREGVLEIVSAKGKPAPAPLLYVAVRLRGYTGPRMIHIVVESLFLQCKKWDRPRTTTTKRAVGDSWTAVYLSRAKGVDDIIVAAPMPFHRIARVGTRRPGL